MSDLDDLEELIGPIQWRPPKARPKQRHMQIGERKTHCHRGHELTPENLYARTDGKRICKKCNRLRILCREDS